MGKEERIPAIKHGVGDIKSGTELSNSISASQILRDNTQDEKKPISAVGNDQIRENGMGMCTAGADNAADADRVINSPAGNEINEIPIIGVMGMAGVGSTARRAGFFFREKTGHKRIKKKFRRRFNTD